MRQTENRCCAILRCTSSTAVNKYCIVLSRTFHHHLSQDTCKWWYTHVSHMVHFGKFGVWKYQYFFNPLRIRLNFRLTRTTVTIGKAQGEGGGRKGRGVWKHDNGISIPAPYCTRMMKKKKGALRVSTMDSIGTTKKKARGGGGLKCLLTVKHWWVIIIIIWDDCWSCEQ